MKLALMAGLIAATAVVATQARAVPDTLGDQFMTAPPKKTVYATEHHMGFSMRAAIIRWLGGVTVVDEHDRRASEREKWWGSEVPVAPAEVIQGSDR